MYIAMLILVVQGLIMYPPRWFRFTRTLTSRPASPTTA
jgi:hypothetical protein